MKTIFNFSAKTFSLLGLILMAFSFNSCNDNDEDEEWGVWDIAPVNVEIILQNADGENILLPDVAGSYYGKDITVEYEGKSYTAQWEPDPKSRMLFVMFTGLTFQKGQSWVDGKWEWDTTKDHLSFGDFRGDENQDISFTLKIEGQPDSYNFDITHRITWKKGEPIISTVRKLNGEELERGIVTITL